MYSLILTKIEAEMCWTIDAHRASYDGMWSASNHSDCCNCCLWLTNLRRFEGLDRASDEGVDRYEGTPTNNRGTALGVRVGFLST